MQVSPAPAVGFLQSNNPDRGDDGDDFAIWTAHCLLIAANIASDFAFAAFGPL